MEISKATYDKLVDMVNLFMQAPTFELEGKFKGDLSKDAFTRCIQYCKSLKMAEKVHDEVLDTIVRFDEVYRVSFKGKNAIANLYKTNRMPDDYDTVETMKKSFIKGVKAVLIDDLSFKVDLKDEQVVDDKKRAEIALKFPSLDKGFRFKKRFSYTDVKNGLRFDFSIVRTSRMIANDFMCHKNLAASGTLQNADRFEVEIEVIKDDVKRTKPNIAKALVSSMIAMYLQVVDEKHFLSNDSKGEIVKGYLKLCYGKSSQSIGAIIKKAIYRPKDYFIGPQPVTLERKNVIQPGLGIVSIVEDYTVTEKADGERCLLYVAGDGKCFIINNRLNVRYTGVKINRYINSVFDGEYITRDTLGRKLSMFGIFDVYYNNGADVRAYPLVSEGKSESRFKLMQQFANQCKDAFASDGMTLFAKEFKHDGDIFKLSKEVWDKEQSGVYPYKIDGLIYTPKHLAVGGRFLKDEPANIRTWDMVFKWKPPQENTIDFLIRFEKDDKGEPYLVLKDSKYYKMATLYVGYNPTLHERLTAMKFLTNDLKQTQSYIPKEFIPGDVVDASVCKSYLEIEQNAASLVKIAPKCLNGDPIEDNSIVEFAYHEGASAEYPLRWKPLRVRNDKTEMLRKFGLSHTANDYTTAMNVWSSIHYPVTTDIITGKDTVSSTDIPDEDVYFTSTLDRYKYASIIMKDFHNKYIKNRALIGMMPKGASIFDIACGKAGDLKKWKDAGFSKVLGIDVVRDNIENRTNGAYARTIEGQKKYGLETSKMPIVYLTADASKRLNPEYIENMEDPDDRQIAKILWGMTRPASIKQEQLHRYYNYVQGGFDVISCQFAIHYFFENEQILDNFVYNVDTYLKKGGYFIGTCLDGYLVKDKLKSLKKGQSVQGVRDGRVLWNIKKLYSTNTKIKLGEQIEIFMESIGKPIKEYLVDFNLLQSKLADKGIEVLSADDCAAFGIDKSIESFKTTFGKITSGDVLNMSQEEKEYSFLNSWFIFRKY